MYCSICKEPVSRIKSHVATNRHQSNLKNIVVSELPDDIIEKLVMMTPSITNLNKCVIIEWTPSQHNSTAKSSTQDL